MRAKIINAAVSKIYDDKTVLLLYNNTYQKEMHYPLINIADFAFILAFFVLPALFSTGTGNVTVPDAEHIPWLSVIVYSALTAYMIVRYHTTKHSLSVYENDDGNAKGFAAKKLSRLCLWFVNSFTTLIYLCIANYIITKLALHSGGDTSLPEITVTAANTKDKLFLVFWTALLACFEEFTYRWLLPVRLRSFMLHGKPDDDYTVTEKILCEISIICLFALSHRYMGWWAVLNALIAGIILRTRFFISGSVYPALIAHILYNLIAFYGILTP